MIFAVWKQRPNSWQSLSKYSSQKSILEEIANYTHSILHFEWSLFRLDDNH